MDLAKKMNILMTKTNITTPTELAKKMEEANLKLPYTTIVAILKGEIKNITLNKANKIKLFFNSILPLDQKLILDDLLDDNIDINVKLVSINKVNLEGLNNKQIAALNQYADYLRNLDTD